jgi:uncharacterized RDD family membrane protein YckC
VARLLHPGHLALVDRTSEQDGADRRHRHLEFSVLGIVLVIGVCTLLYEAVTTVRFGRSPGKAIMKIRPVCLDGSALSAGRSFARAGAYYAAGFVSVLQLLNVLWCLWCLWDEDAQCLHDKVCETLVVSDD